MTKLVKPEFSQEEKRQIKVKASDFMRSPVVQGYLHGRPDGTRSVLLDSATKELENAYRANHQLVEEGKAPLEPDQYCLKFDPTTSIVKTVYREKVEREQKLEAQRVAVEMANDGYEG